MICPGMAVSTCRYSHSNALVDFGCTRQSPRGAMIQVKLCSAITCSRFSSCPNVKITNSYKYITNFCPRINSNRVDHSFCLNNFQQVSETMSAPSGFSITALYSGAFGH